MNTTNYPDTMSDSVERATVRRARRSAEKPGRKWQGDSFRDKTEKAAGSLALLPMFATIALWRVLFPESVWLGVLVALAVGVATVAAFEAWQRRRTPDVADSIGDGYEYDPRH